MTHPMALRSTPVIACLLVAALLSTVLPSPATAQTSKTTEFVDLQGQARSAPYLTSEEYQEVRVNGDARLGELLTAPSVDRVTSLLGEPRAIERTGSESGDGLFNANLRFDGASVSYKRTTDGRTGVQSIELASPEWSMTIQGADIRPGMPVRKLAPVLRSAIRPPAGHAKSDTGGFAIIRVAKPDAQPNGRVPLLQDGQTKIVLFIDEEDRTIERIQFFRVFV